MAITLGIAGLDIALPNPTPFQIREAAKYPSYGKNAPDITVNVTDAEIKAENNCNVVHEMDYLRDVCTYRSICEQLDVFDAFVLHAAAVSVDGRNAYAFCARSGTGKSTHIALWRREYQARVRIINGDKPIIRFFDGIAYVCGTPWAGKENWNLNVRFPLKAICFLEQSGTNEMIRLKKSEAVSPLMQQVLHAKSTDGFARQSALLDRMLAQADVYRLKCNVSAEAARLSFETMTGR